MSNFSYRFFDNCTALAQRLLSPLCALCGAAGGRDGLCEGCRHALPRLPIPRCPVCAVPNPLAEICGRCLKKRPAFDRVVSGLGYAYPASALVAGLKYRGTLAMARPLAAALSDALANEAYPDVVLPMPLAPGRLVQRGFNQATEVARLVAAEYGLKVSVAVASRKRDSVPQASLPWKERSANVRNAFHCEADLQGKSVAVVDDVLTTGATLNELARVLKQRGAREVIGWAATRTLPN